MQALQRRPPKHLVVYMAQLNDTREHENAMLVNEINIQPSFENSFNFFDLLHGPHPHSVHCVPFFYFIVANVTLLDHFLDC